MKSSWVTAILTGYLALSFWPVRECPAQASAPPAQGQQTGSAEPVPHYAGATSVGSLFARSRNSLIFSIGVAGNYDDNINMTTDADRLSDTFTNISPRLSFQREFRRSTLAFDYGPTGMIYHRHSNLSQISHEGGLDFSYSLTPRWQWSLNDRISASPYPNRYSQNEPILDPLPPDISPNGTLLVTRTNTIRNTLTTGLSYQLSRRSQMGWEANYSLDRFSGGNLADNNRYGAGINYSYQLTQLTGLNLGYGFTYYESKGLPASPGTIGTVNGIARTHSGLFGLSRRLTAKASAFLNVGVVGLDNGINSSISGEAVSSGNFRSHFSFNGGINVQGDRTYFSLNLGQNVSDGYGLTTVARVQSAGFSLGRRLARRATASISASYSRNLSLRDSNVVLQTGATNGVNAGPYLRFDFTDRLSLSANYYYTLQRANVTTTSLPGRMTTNLATLSISYRLPLFFRR